MKNGYHDLPPKREYRYNVSKKGGINGQDELLSREIFTTLEETRVLIEQWRR